MGSAASPFVWVLAEPQLLVRFAASPERRQRNLGDMLLLGPVDSARLRSLNLIRLTFILPTATPLPKWDLVDPPMLSEIDGARPSVDWAFALWSGEIGPFKVLGLDQTADDRRAIERLYAGWETGADNDDEVIRFLVRMFSLSKPRSSDDSDQIAALGLQIALPSLSKPISVLAKSRNISENHARQLIHRLRNKGYLPPSVKGRSEP